MNAIFGIILAFIYYFSTSALSSYLFGNMYLVYAFLLLPIALLFFYKKIRIRYNLEQTIIIYFYVFFCNFSALVNSDLELLFGGFSYAVLFLSTTILMNSVFEDKSQKILIWTILITQIPIILIPIMTKGIFYPYNGIFNNPNSLGVTVTTLFVLLFAIFLGKLEAILFKTREKIVFKTVLLALVLMFTFFLVVISGSRTSFLTCVLSVILGFLLILIKSIKFHQFRNLIVHAFYFFSFLGMMYWLIEHIIPIRYYVEEIMFKKFERKSTDPLNGRGWIWEKTINEAGLFGQGSNYFEQVGMSPHNTFISILGQYGWFALVCFVLFIMIGFLYTYKFAFSDNKYKYLPIMMLINFILLSMGENMLFNISMIVAFVLIGVAANNKKLTLIQHEDIVFYKLKRKNDFSSTE